MIRISIIGMGLIGTSLGMALHNADPKTSPLGETWVVGYDRDQHATAEARSRLAVDQVARSLAEAVEATQLVVIATPVQAVYDTLAELATLLPEHAITTDTASTKAGVCARAAELLPRPGRFVGGHPMAGKEQAGARAADPHLFQEAIYCLTPAVDTDRSAISAVEALVATVGARPYYVDPAEHDAYVAGISHLPFVLSAALVEATSRSPAWKEMATLAASGFRDVSRLASGDPMMHRDICLTNRAALLRWIDDMISCLHEMRDMVDESESEQLHALFVHAREVRNAWLDSRPGLRPGEDAFTRRPQIERPGLAGRLRPPDRKQRP